MEKEKRHKMNFSETRSFLIPIISNNTGYQENEVLRIINNNNKLPLVENDGHITTFTRFIAHMSLLAQGSPGFSGPRGYRPSLVSIKNISSLSNISVRKAKAYFEEFKGKTKNIESVLLDHLRLTASNPDYSPKGVKFSSDDIRSGIFIPKTIDKPTAQALGIIYGNGTLGNRTNLALTSALVNDDFYKNTVRQTLEEAFNFLPNQEIAYPKHSFSEKKFTGLRLNYCSKALQTFLTEYLGYPKNKAQKRKYGISEKIKNADKKVQDEFLKYFLASCISFDPNTGRVKTSNISEQVLKNIEVMVNERVTKHSTNICPNGKSAHTLSVSTIPTMELYLLGFLNENPRIKKEVENYFTTRLGKKTAPYLEKKYKDLVPRPIKTEEVIFDASRK